jgi:quinol monooxygenase YgiN
MDDTPIVLNVHMEAAAGREHDLERELRALIEPTRKEPGCLAYQLHRDIAHPGKFMFYEKFKSQVALDEHVNSDHFKKFRDYCTTKGDPSAVTTVTRWRAIG